MDILENVNEIGNKISNDLDLKNLQDKFLNSTIGKIANNAIDLGLRTMLPDFIENEVIEVKDALVSGGIKEGLDSAIENAIELGKKALGIENNEFTSIEQARESLKQGGFIEGVSEKIGNALNSLSTTNNISNISKNDITNNIDKNIEEEFDKEIKALEKIKKYINNWEKCYLKKDLEGLTKEYNKIEKQVNKILPLKNILDNINKIENINKLINNSENFDFNNIYLDLASNL